MFRTTLARIAIGMPLLLVLNCYALAESRDPDTVKRQAFEWLKEKSESYGTTNVVLPPQRPGQEALIREQTTLIVALDDCTLKVARTAHFFNSDAANTIDVSIPMGAVRVSGVHVKVHASEFAALGGSSDAAEVVIPTQSNPSSPSGISFNSTDIAERAARAVIDLAIACGAEDKKEAY